MLKSIGQILFKSKWGGERQWERDGERGWVGRETRKRVKETQVNRKKISPLRRFWWHPDEPLLVFSSGCRLPTKWGGVGLGEESTKVLFHWVSVVQSLGGNGPSSTGCCFVIPLSAFSLIWNTSLSLQVGAAFCSWEATVCITSKAPNQLLEPLAPVS